MPRVKRPAAGRRQLIESLGQEARQFSTATVMLHAAIAEQLGLNITDHKAADILSRTGPITAGELARHTGLTTGAVTGIIDRLERAGMAKREKDPNDRRRVIVALAMKPETERQMTEIFEPLARATAQLAGSYGDKDLAMILNFLKRAGALSYEQMARMRGQGK